MYDLKFKSVAIVESYYCNGNIPRRLNNYGLENKLDRTSLSSSKNCRFGGEGAEGKKITSKLIIVVNRNEMRR